MTQIWSSTWFTSRANSKSADLILLDLENSDHMFNDLIQA